MLSFRHNSIWHWTLIAGRISWEFDYDFCEWCGLLGLTDHTITTLPALMFSSWESHIFVHDSANYYINSNLITILIIDGLETPTNISYTNNALCIVASQHMTLDSVFQICHLWSSRVAWEHHHFQVLTQDTQLSILDINCQSFTGSECWNY